MKIGGWYIERVYGPGIGIGRKSWRTWIGLGRKLQWRRDPAWVALHPCDDRPYLSDPAGLLIGLPPFRVHIEWSPNIRFEEPAA